VTEPCRIRGFGQVSKVFGDGGAAAEDGTAHAKTTTNTIVRRDMAGLRFEIKLPEISLRTWRRRTISVEETALVPSGTAE
jgi:hypothetical protein